MKIQNEKATISIGEDTSNKLFEEILLHELYHVFQYTLGFPDLKTLMQNDPLFQQCTIFISSVIMDQDVDRFLTEHKITLHKDSGAHQYQAYKLKVERWASPKFAPKVLPVESLTFAAIFSNLYLTYNKQKAKYLIDTMDRFDSNIRNYTNTLLDIIKDGNFSTPHGCREIYQRCIKEFPFMGWHISETSFQSI